VFLQAGLQAAFGLFPDTPLRIFEMGFGSGLNALLTALEAQKCLRPVHYVSVEAFPLQAQETALLNYGRELDAEGLFNELQAAPWEQNNIINEWVTLRKEHKELQRFSAAPFHVIYYDAFAPAAQPELWTEERFRQLYDLLLPGGLLSTYCSKGTVRRAMIAAGFEVEKLPGPPGKREMVRAHRRG